MDDGTEPDVVQFKPKAEPQDGILCKPERKPFGKFCQHKNMVVVEARRILRCEDCQECFEPFDYLNRMAHTQQAKFDRLKRLEQGIADAEARLESLLKDERNAKARLKRSVRVESA